MTHTNIKLIILLQNPFLFFAKIDFSKVWLKILTIIWRWSLLLQTKLLLSSFSWLSCCRTAESGIYEHIIVIIFVVKMNVGSTMYSSLIPLSHMPFVAGELNDKLNIEQSYKKFLVEKGEVDESLISATAKVKCFVLISVW